MRPATQDEPGGFSLFGGILPRRFVTESPTMTTRAELDALQSRWRQDIQFTQPVLGRPLHFTSTWGLFSPEQLDEGSLMLLDHIAFRAADHSIDLGCGYGVLGMTAARECPQGQHLLIDKDFVAVDYARRNCAANGLGNAEALKDNPRQYLNRLSDLMFVLARVLNRMNGGDDVYWKSERLARLADENDAAFFGHLRRLGRPSIVSAGMGPAGILGLARRLVEAVESLRPQQP